MNGTIRKGEDTPQNVVALFTIIFFFNRKQYQSLHSSFQAKLNQPKPHTTFGLLAFIRD